MDWGLPFPVYDMNWHSAMRAASNQLSADSTLVSFQKNSNAEHYHPGQVYSLSVASQGMLG